MSELADTERMDRALELAAAVRALTPPNPWVGCVIETADGQCFEGATEPVGGPPRRGGRPRGGRAAGAELTGSTVWVTLEPCSHHGRTAARAPTPSSPPAWLGWSWPSRTPTRRWRATGSRGCGRRASRSTWASARPRSADQLAPYLVHRRTGRPFVVLKLAASLDGRTAAPDGSSRWITGPEARADAHALRAESDAVLVGAGTVRADDPALTVRDAPAPRGDPLRVVLGTRPPGRRCTPASSARARCPSCSTSSEALGCVQLLVEGGATVAHAFHEAGLVDRYVALPRARALRRRRRRPAVRRPGRTDDRRRHSRPGCVRSCASATTSASTSIPTGAEG